MGSHSPPREQGCVHVTKGWWKDGDKGRGVRSGSHVKKVRSGVWFRHGALEGPGRSRQNQNQKLAVESERPGVAMCSCPKAVVELFRGES